MQGMERDKREIQIDGKVDKRWEIRRDAEMEESE